MGIRVQLVAATIITALVVISPVVTAGTNSSCLRAPYQKLLNETVTTRTPEQFMQQVSALLRKEKIPEEQIELFLKEIEKAKTRCKR